MKLVFSPDSLLDSATSAWLGVLTGTPTRHTTWRHIDDFLVDHDPVRAELNRASEPPAAAQAT